MMIFSMLPCRVEGCDDKTFDESGVCPACRTKIERGEITVLPAVDEREQLDTIIGGFLALAGALVGISLARWFDATGGTL
jgi:hypothetical protein